MVKHSIYTSKDARVLVLDDVRIKEINWQLIGAVNAMYEVFLKYGEIAMITGAYNSPAYPKGGIHDRGLAWDFRSSCISKPRLVLKEIEAILKSIDRRYRVLYHNVGYGYHYHIEFRP